MLSARGSSGVCHPSIGSACPRAAAATRRAATSAPKTAEAGSVARPTSTRARTTRDTGTQAPMVGSAARSCRPARTTTSAETVSAVSAALAATLRRAAATPRTAVSSAPLTAAEASVVPETLEFPTRAPASAAASCRLARRARSVDQAGSADATPASVLLRRASAIRRRGRLSALKTAAVACAASPGLTLACVPTGASVRASVLPARATPNACAASAACGRPTRVCPAPAPVAPRESSAPPTATARSARSKTQASVPVTRECSASASCRPA